MTDTATRPAVTGFDQKEVSYWMSEFEKCKSARLPFDNQWYLNLAFFNGNQYVVWAPNTAPVSRQTLTVPPAARYRVRLVVNKVKPAIRTEITKLTKQEPQFYVSAQTAEPSDLAAARIAEGVCVYILDKANFNRCRRDSTFWLSICGTSYLKTYIVEDPNNEMASNIFIESVSAFHIFVPNIQETEIEKQPYVIHARTMDREVVEEMFDIKLGSVKTASSNGSVGTTSNEEQRFLTALGIKTSGVSNNLCFVLEIWVKPCKRYPKGAMLVIVDSKVVYVSQPAPEPPPELTAGEGAVGALDSETGEISPEMQMPQENPLDRVGMMLSALQGQMQKLDPSSPTFGFSDSQFPFSHGMFPFAKMEHVPSGMFYGTSIIQDLIPIQRVYNKTRSQVLEIQDRVSKPQWFYTRGSIDPNKVTSEPGLMIPVNPGFDDPRIPDPPSEPVVFQNEIDRANADFDGIAAQYEITKGRTPPGIEAASAISYLSELNDEKLYHTVASIEDATRVVGYQALILAQDYWDEEKTVKITGLNGAEEAIQFKGADIKNNTDLRVETGSMAPRSRTATQAFITELIKLGVIPPEKGLRYLEMSSTNQLYQESQADSRQAQRENMKMTNGGQILPPNPWDNHNVHLYEHGLYLKSQEFESLEDEVKKVHVQHYLLTQQAIAGVASGNTAAVYGANDAEPEPSVPGNPDPNVSTGDVYSGTA